MDCLLPVFVSVMSKPKKEELPVEVVDPAADGGSPFRVSAVFAAWFFVVGVVLYALVIFAPVFGSDNILLTTDDGIGVLSRRKSFLPDSIFGSWNDGSLMGYPTYTLLNWTSTLLAIFPVEFVINWLHGIDLVVASVFLMLFLRNRGIGWAGCSMGALTAYWLSTNLTLTYAGHIGKYGVLLFAALFLWLIDRAVSKRSVLWSILAGGAMGAMYLEQTDLALFFSLILGPYALFLLWREHRFAPQPAALILVPMLLTALLLALHPLLGGYKLFVKDAESAETKKDPQEAWDFATQWSWPPKESIDFIAPGFMGWRTGEPKGPYYGTMGRSAGWEQTGHGFQNFKLENVYVGAVPVGLALWVIPLAIWARKRNRSAPEIIFWGVVLLLTFWLACGKYLGLYRLLYALPMVSSIRNPNKFLQIMQIALAVLSAFGVEALAGALKKDFVNVLSKRTRMICVIVAAAFAGLLALYWLGSMFSSAQLVEAFSKKGMKDFADIIIQNRVGATLQGFLMAAVFGLFFAGAMYATRPGACRALWIAAWVLVALVAVDAKLLSRHYIKTMSLAQIGSNPVMRVLQREAGHGRTALPSQTGFYGNWLTYDIPYHNIRTVNVTAAPRMPSDYKSFISSLGRTPWRYWQLSGVRLLLGPGNIWGQLDGNPATKGKTRIAYAFNIEPAADGNVKVIEASDTVPGSHCVLQIKEGGQRFRVVDDWEVLDKKAALARIAEPGFKPLEQVVVSDVDQDFPLPQESDAGNPGRINIESIKPGFVRAKVSVTRPSILRIADRYDPLWKAQVGGKEAPVVVCDYLFQGIYLSPGLHRVDLTYDPPQTTLWVQFLGTGICVLAIIVLVYSRFRKQPVQPGIQP
jgi:hypothetical protein